MSSIPKVIHYCWFGDKEKPEIVNKCIESWKKNLPDYEFKEWGNNDLKFVKNQYVEEAIKYKKWAFVSDYFRLYALYNYGGIYLDTDEEVFKSFEYFLDLDFFIGFEENYKNVNILASVIGAKKHNSFIKEFLNLYEDIHFVNEDNDIDYTTINKRIEDYLCKVSSLKRPFKKNEKFILAENAIIFPVNYFCTYNSDITIAMHHYNSSWLPDLKVYKVVKFLFFKLRIYSVKQGRFLKNIFNVKGLPFFAYPRFGKRSIILTIEINRNNKEKNNKCY